MSNVYFDTETKSGADLSEVGSVRYFADRQADLLCLAYEIDNNPTKLWIPGNPVPTPFLNPKRHTFYAQNIQFDWSSINALGPKHGFRPLSIANCIDVMALCAKYTFPQGLDAAGKVLGVPIPKLAIGKALKKKICMPPFKYTEEDLRNFYKYCMFDVRSMVCILKALPAEALTTIEQKIWRTTVDINQRGIPIDLATAVRVNATVDFYMKKRAKSLPILTKEAVHKPTQVARIRNWLFNEYAIETENLNKDTVTELLDEGYRGVPLSPEALEVLRIRQDIGGAAVKKYKRLIPQIFNGRIYNNLRYGAASTLRFGGLGFQVHNMPRDSVENPDACINRFANGDILFNSYEEWKDGLKTEHSLMECAKALIRPCIKASEGYELLAGDFGSVEAVFLMWMAGEYEVLARLADGFDMYVDMASDLYEIPYDQINYTQRFLGKTLVLGAGYNLAWRGFIEYARGYGLDISEEMARRAIEKYRYKHARVVKMWYALKNCAMSAVKNPRVAFKFRNITFKSDFDRNKNKWLTIRLPSGSVLYYFKPFIKEGKYGPGVAHYGINSKTKQWTVKDLIPGRITENVDQRLSRDRLCFTIDQLVKEDYHPIFHVHDECVCEEETGTRSLEEYIKIYKINPAWCPTLPLSADGYVAQRYKKG